MLPSSGYASPSGVPTMYVSCVIQWSTSRSCRHSGSASHLTAHISPFRKTRMQGTRSGPDADWSRGGRRRRHDATQSATRAVTRRRRGGRPGTGARLPPPERRRRRRQGRSPRARRWPLHRGTAPTSARQGSRPPSPRRPAARRRTTPRNRAASAGAHADRTSASADQASSSMQPPLGTPMEGTRGGGCPKKLERAEAACVQC